MKTFLLLIDSIVYNYSSTMASRLMWGTIGAPNGILLI